jgi:hypothetical protein
MLNQIISDIKFAVSCSKEIEMKEVNNEVHFFLEDKNMGYWVVTKEDAEEIKKHLPEKEVEENPQFGSFEKKVKYKGIEVIIKTNFYEYKKTIMAESDGCYTYTKTDIEEDLLKTHYRKMKKKGLI